MDKQKILTLWRSSFNKTVAFYIINNCIFWKFFIDQLSPICNSYSSERCTTSFLFIELLWYICKGKSYNNMFLRVFRTYILCTQSNKIVNRCVFALVANVAVRGAGNGLFSKFNYGSTANQLLRFDSTINYTKSSWIQPCESSLFSRKTTHIFLLLLMWWNLMKWTFVPLYRLLFKILFWYTVYEYYGTSCFG